MRRTAKIISSLLGATALVATSIGTADADVLNNNVGGAGSTVTVAAGTTTLVAFRVNPTATPSGDPAGCDASGGGDKTTITVSSTSGYTNLKLKGQGAATAGSVSFDAVNCKQSKKFQFIVAAGTPGGTTWSIHAAATDGVAGSLYTNSGDFTLKVSATAAATSLALAPASTSITYGTATQTWTATLTSASVGVASKLINFNVGGTLLSATTNASGVATLVAPIGTNYAADPLAYDIDAAFDGDSSFASSSDTGTFTITKASQTAMAITGPTSGGFGQTLPITYTGGSGTGAVTFGASGACTLAASGTDVTITSGSGTCTITGGKAADTNYNAVVATPQAFTVGKASQGALTITSPSTGTYNDLLDITYSGGNGTGAVTFSAAGSTACAIESGQLRITGGTGTCSITATKAGDTNYSPTTSAAHTVTVGKAAPTLSVTAPDAGTFDESYDIEYSSSGGTGAVTFDAGSSTACEIVGSQVHITHGTGTCDITATQAADDNFSQVTSAAHSVVPDKATASIELGSLTAGYDGNGHAATATTTPGGLSGVTITYDGDSALPVDAGSYAVVASLSNADYAAEDAIGTLVISPKTLTGAITADDKEYDGTTAATVHAVALTGVVGTDDVALEATNGAFDSATAGTGKNVTADLALSGDDAANYALYADTASTSADIDRRTVTGSVTASNKTYDRTNTASASPATPSALDRVVDGDDVSLVVDSATFDGVNAGAHTVTAVLSLSGDDADNYQLTSTTATAPASIDPLALTATITADNKVYDGSAAATVHPTLGAGVISPDVVSVSPYDAAFSDANVGDGKSVTASLQLGGADSGNYSLPADGYSTTANITAKPLTGSITASSKQYDGSDAATVSAVNPIPGIVGTDEVTLTASNGHFANPNVGTGKTVTADLGLTGGQAGNYSLSSSTATTTADITAKPLTGSISASNKVYDGTTAATVSPVNPIPGIVGTDPVTLTATNGRFADANAGDNKTVTADLGLTGAKAGNYSLSSPTATAQANITKAPLTVTASSASVKKGDPVPTITPSYSGWVNGEGTSALTTLATCSTTYTTSSDVGSYPTSCSGVTAQNYAPSYVNGSVTVSYLFNGFFQPIDNLPAINRAKAGSAIPVKFSLGGNQGLDIFRAGSPTSQTVTCGANAPDDIESTVTAGGSSLTYDSTANQYVYVWKTDSKWAGTCRQLVVVFKDGSTQRANFTFTK